MGGGERLRDEGWVGDAGRGLGIGVGVGWGMCARGLSAMGETLEKRWEPCTCTIFSQLNSPAQGG